MELAQSAFALVLGALVLGSVLVVSRLHDGRSWRKVLGDRFLYGVPWGSLIVLGGVFGVYLFVQDGITHFHDPVTIPYRAWSYYYPLGVLSASFTHAGSSHLLNNLAAAAVVAPIAEYAWGHYPRGRDDHETTSRMTTPWIRAVVIFPLAVALVALATSAFALGPVIGFSSVVFAFAGFALVRYPIVTVVATLGGQGVLLTLYQAVQSPVFEYVAQPSPASAPSWASVAIQGHGLGLVIGLLLGALVFHRRGYHPDPLRFWLALVLFGFARSLWAIYWFGEQNTYLLFRGLGVVVVIALALVVTLAVTASDRPIRIARFRTDDGPKPTTGVPRAVLQRGLAEARGAVDRTDRIAAIAGTSRREPASADGVSPRSVAFLAVLLVLAALMGPAIPVNMFVTEGPSTADGAVEVRDYTVFYDEGVENELVSFVDVEAFDQSTGLETSGVIVASEQRNIWMEAVTAQRLAFTGYERVSVGGPGWREIVHVERTGWEPVGNATVYQVETWADGEDRELAYESASSQADVRIDDRTISIASVDGTFALVVESPNGDERDAVAIPEEGDTATADGLTFDREDETIYASADGTEVAVATQETYN
ncbi:rhomboid family intramembrane serine protease [Halobacteria archaeon AArc-dxtr1]|nr:rhomboid family intramembrane serine protease [Halobacteria archaeon AArc-dxtr1]